MSALAYDTPMLVMLERRQLESVVSGERLRLKAIGESLRLKAIEQLARWGYGGVVESKRLRLSRVGRNLQCGDEQKQQREECERRVGTTFLRDIRSFGVFHRPHRRR